MVPFWFLPYAIATGNTVVVKPSEQVPLSQLAPLRAACTRAEAPEGGRQHGQRRRRTSSNAHPRAPRTSRASRSSARPRSPSTSTSAAARPASASQALGGAKNFTVVTDDCDWEKTHRRTSSTARSAAPGSAASRRASSSASAAPTASSRRSSSRARRRSRSATASSPASRWARVISAKHKERVLGYIEKGREGGGGAPPRRAQPEGDGEPQGALPRADDLHQGVALA